MDYLKPLNDHQSTATLHVGIAHESNKDHPGDVIRVPVTVTAAVITDALPSLGSLLNAGAAGAALADAPVAAALGFSAAPAGVAAGWFQEIHTINASTVLTVTRHKLNPGLWHGTIRVTTEDVEDGVTNDAHGKFWSKQYNKVTMVRQDVMSVENVDLSQPEHAVLTLADDATYEYTGDLVGSDNIGAGQCGGTPRYHETVTQHAHGWEHGAAQPEATVELSAVGVKGPKGGENEYQLALARMPPLLPVTYFYDKNLAEYATAIEGVNCRGGEHHWSETQPPFGSGMANAAVPKVFGPTDPGQPDRLPGHLIGRQVFSSGSATDGVTDSKTITVSWDLQRETKPAVANGLP